LINNTISLDEVQQPDPDPYESTLGIFNYSGWGIVTGNTIFGGDHGYYSKAGTIEFANNVIVNSYTGFYSMGAEEVHDNTIINCKGDGMILDGLKGPIFSNTIKNNAGAGIRILRTPIDLGGGKDNCPGLNELTGNGNFDLYIEASSTQFPVLYACYNVWDHTDTLEILQYDIRDGSDSAGLVKVSFTPAGGQGINNTISENQLKLFPNPISQMAFFNWVLSKRSLVSLKIFDNIGRDIKTLVNNQLDPGEHQAIFDASSLPAGVYFYQIQANGKIETKKMVVCK
jgi:hypothetical protein